VDVDGEVFNVKVSPPAGRITEVEEAKAPSVVTKGAVVSPLRGVVLRLNVKPGDRVKRGAAVAVIEALKMEINVAASHSGVVVGIFVYEGQRVWAGETLLVVE